MVHDEIKIIEGKYEFYQIKDQYGNFIWDGIRYDVITSIMAKTFHSISTLKDGNSSNFKRHIKVLKNYFSEMVSLMSIPFLSKKKFVFSVSSRFKNDFNSYDKSADSIINMLEEKDYYVINHHVPRNTRYKSHSDSLHLFMHLAWARKRDVTTIRFFADNINAEYGKDVISYSKVEELINKFYLSVIYYKYLLKRLRPLKVFISYGRYKALTEAAHSLNIKVYLLQHALVFENDFALCNTSPDKKHGYFPDYFLTFGSFWGQYMSHLMKVETIGNDYLCKSGNPKNGKEVLFISTDSQGVFLSGLMLEFAEGNPTITCSYRLHPSEYKNADYYMGYFSKCPNIHVITINMSITESIEKCQIVVGIFSTVLFEALHSYRKVAIYDIPEFSSYTSNFRNVPNAFFIKNEADLVRLLNIDYSETDMIFFEPFDKGKAKSIINKR
ncbi:MAG: hypothetical protein AB9922_02520 [Bacteroidales bacterium]